MKINKGSYYCELIIKALQAYEIKLDDMITEEKRNATRIDTKILIDRLSDLTNEKDNATILLAQLGYVKKESYFANDDIPF